MGESDTRLSNGKGGKVSDLEIVNNVAAKRWEARSDGALAGVANYEDDGTTLAFTHTFVEPACRGGKVASLLIRAALDDATANNRKVEPACSFVGSYIDRHPQYAELLDG